ncbi:GNAT family N-acetyltransferase [Pelagerythrobacter marensis]|uniref:GNAT family N-acetyltransferase n=1 Tax=Pelagerythrobacter marensis TaxID=543877 RepID=A0ABZ2D1W5_9SPHN
MQGTIPPVACPFDRPEWFALLADSGMPPIFALAEDGGEQAALPLTRANGRLEALRNWYSFTWRPLGTGGPDRERLLIALARDLRQRAHRVTLWPVPDEDGSATRLERAFRGGGWRVVREQCDHNHVLEVKGRSFAEYWSARPGRMRTTLKRKGKRVDVTIRERFDADDWAAYEAIYAESWKPDEETPGLLRRFAQQEGDAGRIRLAVAKHQGVPVAAQFWTVEGGTAYIHKLAHREAHKALSAGTTLTAALFEHVIDRDRVEWVDFGTGNDPYKADWMEIVRPRFRIDCLDPRQPRAWPLLAKRLVRRLAPGARQG